MTRFFLLAVALPCLALTACQRDAAVAAEPAFDATPSAVVLRGSAPATALFHVSTATASGELAPRPVTARVGTLESLTSSYASPLAGRIEALTVRLGDRVKAGDKLVQVRTAELPTLEREAAAARALLDARKAQLERLKLLVEARAVPEADRVVAESELTQARIEASAAAARLRSLAVVASGPDSFWLVATRDGSVVQLDAALGQQTRPDAQHPLLTVAALDEVLVIGDLDAGDAERVERGAKVRVHIPGVEGEPLAGVVEAVAEVVDPEKQTVAVRARIGNPQHHLRPNAFVSLAISGREGRLVVTVPTEAVVMDGADAFVFVEQRPGAYLRRAVRAGRDVGGRIELLAGLRAGERVVDQGALMLLDATERRGG